MNIGDKVRLLRGKEEGIITKIINEKLVEVEIEDGFRIPAMRNELVVVAAEERSYFEKPEQAMPLAEPKPKEKPADTGLSLAFHALNDKDYSVYLLNNTGNTIPYSIYYQSKTDLRGKTAGHLKPFNHVKVDEFNKKDFDQWPEIIIQVLQFSPKASILLPPLEKRFRFKASSFFKNEKVAPLILKKAHIFEVNNPIKPEVLEKLNTKLTEGSDTTASEKSRVDRPAKVIDLHIEKLVNNFASLSSSQILQIQLQTFEKGLDSAIAGGLEEITFIHGAGNGVLRDAIHKHLSKQPHIQYYKDAMREKFGYGATLVRIG